MLTSSIMVLFGLGLAAALLLAVASKLLAVKEDPRLAQVEDALPGANCGGCGYAGCAGAAQGVVSGKSGANVCVIGGPETAEAVAAVMGLDAGAAEPKLAFRDCTGGSRAEELFLYEGADDCRAQALLYGGTKQCPEGCLGLGSCVRACPFDAIHMGPDNLPVVDPLTCTSCGNCVKACPRGVMEVRGETDKMLSLNRASQCLAPCRQRCPGQIDIPTYINQIRCGDFEGAVNTIRERNPLLLVCGRVCPRPCETVCRRGHVDSPIGINMLKRFAADYEMNSGKRYAMPSGKDTGRKVAIVGGGPAGLSCAYYLRKLGHHPTILESQPELGGQLRYGIPEYRLPKKVLDFEIQGILDMGVEVRRNYSLGHNATLASLRQEGFEAFFMAIGAWEYSTMRCENEDAPGVLGGIEFLTAHALGRAPELGQKVIVVGGGNTAIDCARTARRLGCDVTMVYRRTRAEMPAHEDEIRDTEDEGVNFQFLGQPTKVLLDENGRAAGIEYLRMELGEPDDSGRRRPVPVQGSETRLEADTVIAAIGQKPALNCLYEGGDTCSLESTRWKTIVANPHTLQTSTPDVFAGGDVFTGPDLVISAIGAGRQAARSIHFYMTTGEIPLEDGTLPRQTLLPYTLFREVSGVELDRRAKLPHACSLQTRTCTFAEVEGALSEAEALRESSRCLRCGLICYDQDAQEANPEVPLEQIARS